MKVLLTSQWPYAKIWRFNFLLAFFLFSFSSLQAQDYVSSDVAKDRLTTKAHQLDAQLEQGAISQSEHTINTKFLKSVLNEIGNYDFDWNAENSAELTQIFENAFHTAHTNTLQAHPQNANTIDPIQDELDTLLQQ